MRGRFMGVLGVAWSSATMIGPVVGLLLFEHSPTMLWVAFGALGALAAASAIGCRERNPKSVSPAGALANEAA